MFEIIKNMSNNIGSLSRFLLNPKNIDFLNYLNSNIPKDAYNFKISEKVYYLINGIDVVLLCKCGDPLSFNGFKNGYKSTCGKKKCYVDKRKETCLIKYGVDNPKKSDIIKEKEREKIIKKWGTHFMMNDLVRNKFKNTMVSNWGVEWSQQSPEIREKSNKTWENNKNKEEIISNRKLKMLGKSEEEKNEIENKKKLTISNKWGNYNNFIKYRLEKVKESSNKKWGADHHFKVDEIKNKRILSYKKNNVNKIKSLLPDNIIYLSKYDNLNKTDVIIRLLCNTCNNEFDINRQFFINRILSKTVICLNCNPISSGRSNREIELFDFIKSNYIGDINININGIISKELDIYLPDIKLAFEFNGLYWHSDIYKDNLYHINKTKECLDKNIELVHIWEDDWDLKNDIVKSIILNKLNKSNKIYARKCEVKIIYDINVVRDFLTKNHIQGYVPSRIKIGLYYNDELVSIMTFGSLRVSLGRDSKDGCYELIRFCNKLNTSVIGGASKLFNFFVKKYNPIYVISYSDISRYDGCMYENLSFRFDGYSNPNYYWIVNNVRRHRFNFRKDVLVKNGYDNNKTEFEIMKENGYNRIFDCGNKRWIWESYNI